MLCPSCYKNEGKQTLQGNLLPCNTCQTRQDNLSSPSEPVEIIPEYIKEERKERQDSIEQPSYYGEANRRYIDLYGEDIMLKKGFTRKEIRNAKYVMDSARDKNTAMRYYKDKT